MPTRSATFSTHSGLRWADSFAFSLWGNRKLESVARLSRPELPILRSLFDTSTPFAENSLNC